MVIGGNDGTWNSESGTLDTFSDIEVITSLHNYDQCDPIRLQYAVADHSSVASDQGVITCGGRTSSSCILHSIEDGSRTFPPMTIARFYFGIGIINDVLYAVGGSGTPAAVGATRGSANTMEKIDLKTETEWTSIDLQFHLEGHCVTSAQTKLVVTGGFERPDPVTFKVSQNIKM